MKIIAFIICIITALYVSLSAATVHVSFEFKKKPPMYGAVLLNGADKVSADEKVVIDQVEQKFTAPIVIAPSGATLLIKNSDTVQHNAFGDDTDLKVEFDVGLADPGVEKEQTVSWPNGSAVRIGCKIHPAMQTWVLASDAKYHEVFPFDRKSRNGKSQIKNIDPSAIKSITVWLPAYEPVQGELKDGATFELIKRGKVYGTATVSIK